MRIGRGLVNSFQFPHNYIDIREENYIKNPETSLYLNHKFTEAYHQTVFYKEVQFGNTEDVGGKDSVFLLS